jgi:conserved oligomeric Golgi complex subunit 2
LLLQVEKLIKELPTAPSDSSTVEFSSADKACTSTDTGSLNVEPGTGVRETQSTLLERIASEMNRLKFYISHAQVCVSIFSFAVGDFNSVFLFFIMRKPSG